MNFCTCGYEIPIVFDYCLKCKKPMCVPCISKFENLICFSCTADLKHCFCGQATENKFVCYSEDCKETIYHCDKHVKICPVKDCHRKICDKHKACSQHPNRCSNCHNCYPDFPYPKHLSLNETRYDRFKLGHLMNKKMKDYIFECAICDKKICTQCSRSSNYYILRSNKELAIICSKHVTVCTNLPCSRMFFPLYWCDFENCKESLCPFCSKRVNGLMICHRDIEECKCGREFIKLDKIELKNHDTYFHCESCLFEERKKLSLLNKSFPRDISEKIYQLQFFG